MWNERSKIKCAKMGDHKTEFDLFFRNWVYFTWRIYIHKNLSMYKEDKIFSEILSFDDRNACNMRWDISSMSIRKRKIWRASIFMHYSINWIQWNAFWFLASKILWWNFNLFRNIDERRIFYSMNISRRTRLSFVLSKPVWKPSCTPIICIIYKTSLGIAIQK